MQKLKQSNKHNCITVKLDKFVYGHFDEFPHRQTMKSSLITDVDFLRATFDPFKKNRKLKERLSTLCWPGYTVDKPSECQTIFSKFHLRRRLTIFRFPYKVGGGGRGAGAQENRGREGVREAGEERAGSGRNRGKLRNVA